MLDDGHSKIDKTMILMTNGSLIKVKSPLGAFCNTFDLHLAIIGLENQFSVRVAFLHKFYCTFALKAMAHTGWQ